MFPPVRALGLHGSRRQKLQHMAPPPGVCVAATYGLPQVCVAATYGASPRCLCLCVSLCVHKHTYIYIYTPPPASPRCVCVCVCVCTHTLIYTYIRQLQVDDTCLGDAHTNVQGGWGGGLGDGEGARRVLAGGWGGGGGVRRQTVRPLLGLTGHSNCVSSAVWLASFGLIATASWDRSVLLFDVASGSGGSKALRTLGGHEGPLTAIAAASSSALLLSGSRDCTARLWDARSKVPVVKWSSSQVVK